MNEYFGSAAERPLKLNTLSSGKPLIFGKDPLQPDFYRPFTLQAAGISGRHVL